MSDTAIILTMGALLAVLSVYIRVEARLRECEERERKEQRRKHG